MGEELRLLPPSAPLVTKTGGWRHRGGEGGQCVGPTVPQLPPAQLAKLKVTTPGAGASAREFLPSCPCRLSEVARLGHNEARCSENSPADGHRPRFGEKKVRISPAPSNTAGELGPGSTPALNPPPLPIPSVQPLAAACWFSSASASLRAGVHFDAVQVRGGTACCFAFL